MPNGSCHPTEDMTWFCDREEEDERTDNNTRVNDDATVHNSLNNSDNETMGYHDDDDHTPSQTYADGLSSLMGDDYAETEETELIDDMPRQTHGEMNAEK